MGGNGRRDRETGRGHDLEVGGDHSTFSAVVEEMSSDRWSVDPTDWALRQSAWRRELPQAFCPEVGRRILLAQLEFSEWILRRVEKVEFERDRNVTRRITIEFLVRPDAPRFRDSQGKEYWLVPLSSMRRRTLVNLDLRDEDGKAITMPGIRLTQQLDQAILLAAAALTPPASAAHQAELQEFIRNFIAGTSPEVAAAGRLYRGKNGPVPPCLAPLKANPAFNAALSRLRRNFTLYAFLPIGAGRRRLISLAFDEPTDWRYRTSPLDKKKDGTWRYSAAASPVSWHEKTHILASFALRPTRVRLQVPGAENAASFHFEIAAPQGLRIVGATLLAGRPNDPTRHVSEDHVLGHSPTVGLHAVEVPNGSLCRVQVDFRVPTQGWLTTMLVSCGAILGVLLSVFYHFFFHKLSWDKDHVTNIALLLITTSAGVATLIAQREFGGFAARMVSRLRALGALSATLPIVATGFLVYTAFPPLPKQLKEEKWGIGVLTILALLVFVVALVAWLMSRSSGRHSVVRESPWDMTVKPQSLTATNFLKALRKYDFGSPAVSIRSAEGWHDRYGWTDELQKSVTAQLNDLGHRPNETRHFRTCALFAGPCPGQARATAQ